MAQISLTLDDEVNSTLNKLTNKSEYIRQAISEKLARDKTSKSDNANGKEFMDIMKNLQKSITENTKILANIPDIIKAHESKTMKAYIKNSDYFEGLMYQIYKINMLATESAGWDFVQENSEAMNLEATKLVKEFMEKYNG